MCIIVVFWLAVWSDVLVFKCLAGAWFSLSFKDCKEISSDRVSSRVSSWQSLVLNLVPLKLTQVPLGLPVSSCMLWTERKAIWGQQTWCVYSSDDFEKFTTCISKHWCIAEIQLTWKNLMFVSKLTRYPNPCDAIKRIKDVTVEQQSLPPLPTLTQRYSVPLSGSQCRQLCDSEGTCRQLLVKSDGDSVFKSDIQLPGMRLIPVVFGQVKQLCPKIITILISVSNLFLFLMCQL